MNSISLKGFTPTAGSVFIDNLMIASADRLISGSYTTNQIELARGDSKLASGLFHHDLVSLATLVESIICHDQLLVNHDFIDVWNRDIHNQSLAALRDVVTPLEWPLHDRVEAEQVISASRDLLQPLDLSEHSFLSRFIAAVSPNEHEHRFIRQATSHEEALFSPRDEAHPWGTPHNVIVGTSFYVLLSETLGIPYKPSLIRARMLAHAHERAVNSRTFNAAEIAVSLLEGSREKVVQDYFSRLLESNYVEIAVPGLLTAVVRNASSPTEILSIALQIRNTSSAAAFREWGREFSTTIQNGDLAEIGKFMKEVRSVTEDVNRHLSLNAGTDFSVRLGWGPATYTKAVDLPKFMKKPLYLKRHLWFLHDIYTDLVSTARLSDRLEKLFRPRLPFNFPSIAIEPSIWKQR